MKDSITQWANAGDPNAMIQLAEIFYGEDNLPEAINFYKEAVKLSDVEAIDEKYNEIYVSADGLAQMMTFGSSRLSEFLPEQERAIERRRIKNKILKLKANM